MRSTRRPARGYGGLRVLSFGIALVLLLMADLASADRRPERRTLPQGAPPSAPARAARASDPALESAVGALRSAFGPSADPAIVGPSQAGAVHLSRSRSGHVRALSAPPGRVYPVRRSGAGGRPEDLALAFLQDHRAAFGIARPGTSLRSLGARSDRGRSFVRLEQRLAGLRVFGAGVVVQLEAPGGVAFVLADLARDDSSAHTPGFVTTPVLGAVEAQREALDWVPAERRVPDLAAGDATLMVYEPSVIGHSGTARLVWHVQVRSATAAVHEIVLVDALNGGIAFQYSRIMDAKNRSVYDSNNVPNAPGTLARGEGDAAVVAPDDVNEAYDYLGDTYDFYAGLGRDSFDDAGAALIARVRYCDPLEDPGCPPMANAYWDGSEMRFGDGYTAADDVVAHELTHGVTDYESALIYWGESGAINEALSDIFGELVDQTNGAGTDTPGVKWLIGEDLPGSPAGIRSMADPAAFADPDRRHSPLWSTDSADNRGVHINSGVANKLAFLLTDGGAFNGETVAAQGIVAVSELFYEAQVHLLVPGSDYFDLYAALRQAAVNAGWDTAARNALEAASRAVEIRLAGQQDTVLSDDFEGSFPDRWDIADNSATCGPSGFEQPAAQADWGTTTHRAASGASSLYAGAAGVSPAPVGGPYKSCMDTWTIYGPFSLEGVTDAWAEFDLYLDIEPDFGDDIFWGVSTDGVDFDGFAVQPESGCTGDCTAPIWVREVFNFKDITFQPILGQPQVWLAFNFASDYTVEYEGAYLDNVEIRSTRACPTVVVEPWGVPAATFGDAYSQGFTQTGGNGSIAWGLSGTLPAGLAFHASPAAVSGTPSEVGDFPLTVTATDANGCSGSRDLTLTVGPAGPFAAIALDSDAAGNGILEPGELVSLSPAWRKTTGASEPLTGILTAFSGPGVPDPSYTVPDAAADYGVVGTGAGTSCAGGTGDCYSLRVSAPTSRPTLHWDALARETLSNGQIKDWIVHVGGSFDDVSETSPFYPFIETLLHRSVTAGCSATGYCPTQTTTRAQMAVFVLRAKEGPGYGPPACGGTPVFGDVPASDPFCSWIEELARRGVVSGCGGGNYCPNATVTREQMAVFVLKTLDPGMTPPACATPVFGDVPASSGFCRWVEELARRNVVAGCAVGTYCPTSSVTREQMGVFIGEGFDLSVAGP